MAGPDDVTEEIVDIRLIADEERQVGWALAGCRSPRRRLSNARNVVVRRCPAAVIVRRIRWIFDLKIIEIER